MKDWRIVNLNATGSWNGKVRTREENHWRHKAWIWMKVVNLRRGVRWISKEYRKYS